MSTVWSCGPFYFYGAIWYLPQQAEFKTFPKVSYCHTSMLTPDTLRTQTSAWFLLGSMLYCLVASCGNSKGGLSLSIKLTVTHPKLSRNRNVNTTMNVSNTFKNGETFWGFKSGTGDKHNEQTVCIKEVKSCS